MNTNCVVGEGGALRGGNDRAGGAERTGRAAARARSACGCARSDGRGESAVQQAARVRRAHLFRIDTRLMLTILTYSSNTVQCSLHTRIVLNVMCCRCGSSRAAKWSRAFYSTICSPTSRSRVFHLSTRSPSVVHSTVCSRLNIAVEDFLWEILYFCTVQYSTRVG